MFRKEFYFYVFLAAVLWMDGRKDAAKGNIQNMREKYQKYNAEIKYREREGKICNVQLIFLLLGKHRFILRTYTGHDVVLLDGSGENIRRHEKNPCAGVCTSV